MKAEDEEEWTTREADNARVHLRDRSPGFRIGFGDYYDCDGLPEYGTAVMGWSETVNRTQAWQWWVRTLDMCEDKESLVDVLADEIDYLTAAFETQDFRVPEDHKLQPRFQDNLNELRKKWKRARRGLKASRDANPLPTEETLAEAQTA